MKPKPMHGAARLTKLCCASMLMLASLSQAATPSCKNTGSFSHWLADFKSDALAEGIPQSVVTGALNTVSFQPNVIKKDRAQGVFSQSFLQFSGRMVSKNRLAVGRKQLKKHAGLFKRIEEDFGVPGPVLAAYWGLETDFGGYLGSSETLPALATLAYDCRRGDFFREHLMNALRLVAQGDLQPQQMRGAWAGELGQMQFLPSEYHEFGVDFDGDGKRNMITSSADALASGANLIRSFGWRAGEPWLKEVRVPQAMDWSQARLDNRLQPSQWAAMGVTNRDGSELSSPALPTALLLPMGKNGPAFLAYPNFDVYLEWNQSLVYSTTAAYFATRLAGAPKVRSGNGPVTPLTSAQTKLLQRKLVERGYDVGKIDGIIGSRTRQAVRELQVKMGLSADGYPTASLLDAL